MCMCCCWANHECTKASLHLDCKVQAADAAATLALSLHSSRHIRPKLTRQCTTAQQPNTYCNSYSRTRQVGCSRWTATRPVVVLYTCVRRPLCQKGIAANP